MKQPNCEKALRILVTRIQASMKRKGLTSVRKVADASGVSKSGVDRIYNLEHYPQFDTLLALANAADVTVATWLKPSANWHLQQERLEQGAYPPEQEQPEQEKPEQEPEPEPEPEPEASEAFEKALNAASQGKASPEAETASERPLSILEILHGMKPEA